MSEREINIIIGKVRRLEECFAYEKEDAETMELVGYAYAEYQSTLGYN